MNTPETSTGKVEWYTPPEVVDDLLYAFPAAWRSNVFDPASSAKANEFVRARSFLTIEDDALAPATKWVPADILWMNPPYARGLIDKFVDRFLAECRSGKWKGACVLVNTTSETYAWQRLLRECDAVFFPSKRIQFIDGDTGQQSNKQARGQTVFYFVREYEVAFGVPDMDGLWVNDPEVWTTTREHDTKLVGGVK